MTRKLENSPDSYSEINARKAIYKRVRIQGLLLIQIADLFPQDGWVNTTHVSRECTSSCLLCQCADDGPDGLVKKRRDREEAMEEAF